MPHPYEAIRDQFVKKGYPLKEAKKHAARIYNASKQGKKDPVGPHYKDKED